ncbi:ABC transporter permease [Paenibacillus thermotolerans]|uniref:ABC transporter permease n=1 Tax=Paenibacillus thermotolerans TaxID=3027807 RepID=UPI0023689B02|nr:MULTISPECIES: ABC transporter permease subunit [unclassified Paenibacillus]
MSGNTGLWKQIWRNRLLYALFLPAIAYFILFAYVPFYGLQIAFKDFQVFKGIWESPWVGFEHFGYIFSSEKFLQVIENTVVIHLYRLIAGFPVPILFALLLNELRLMWFKRSVQTITYFPHFLSWVVFSGIILNFIGPAGIINSVLASFGMERVNFLTDPDSFRSILVVTGILKEFGWGAIIYLAALAGIDPHLYEAAKVDGASKLRQIWHVTLPGLRPTILLLLVLDIGHLLDAGFDQIFMLYNPAVLDVADIIDTYVYRIGLLDANYEVATAVGLFKGAIGMALIIIANAIVKKWEGRSLW